MDYILENLHIIYLFIILLFIAFWIKSRVTNSFNIDKEIFHNAKSATKNPEGYKDKTMISNFYKDWWCYMIEPSENLLIKNNVSPNTITIVSLFISLITACIYSQGYIFTGSVFLLAGSTFDMLDGRVARKTNSESTLGSFMDSCFDRFSEIFIMVGLFIYYFPDIFCYVIMVASLFSLTVSYVKAAADNLGLSSNVGLMQRADRVVYLGVGGIISGFCEYFNIIFFNSSHLLFMGVIVIIGIFSFTTTIQRLLYAMKQ